MDNGSIVVSGDKYVINAVSQLAAIGKKVGVHGVTSNSDDNQSVLAKNSNQNSDLRPGSS